MKKFALNIKENYCRYDSYRQSLYVFFNILMYSIHYGNRL